MKHPDQLIHKATAWWKEQKPEAQFEHRLQQRLSFRQVHRERRMIQWLAAAMLALLLLNGYAYRQQQDQGSPEVPSLSELNTTEYAYDFNLKDDE
jgi:hypothetical protein